MLKTKRPQRNGLRILTAAAAVFLLLLLAVVPVSAATGDAVQSVGSTDGLIAALADPGCSKIIVTADILHTGITTTTISREVTITTDGKDHTITCGITLDDDGDDHVLHCNWFKIVSGGNLTFTGNGTSNLTLMGGDYRCTGLACQCIHIQKGKCTLGKGSILENVLAGDRRSYEGDRDSYAVLLEGGEFVLDGGIIRKCQVRYVVYAQYSQDGTAPIMRMEPGSAITHIGHEAYQYNWIYNNKVDKEAFAHRGVVLLGGTFTMNGGEISDCWSGNESSLSLYGEGGGGVYVKGSTFIMNGGNITGNMMSAKRGSNGCVGGGVFVFGGSKPETSGHFIMNGGNITNNTAKGDGSGVYVAGEYGEYATFEMSDDAWIAEDNDVYLGKYSTHSIINVNVTSSLLKGGAENITVDSPENGTLVVKNGTDYLQQFGLSSLMKDKFGLEKYGNDLRLRYITNITLNSNQGTGESPASVIASLNSENLYSDYHLDPPISIINPTRPGYTFGGWYNESGGVGVCVIGTDGKLKPSTSRYTDDSRRWTYSSHTLTLYANWTANTTKITLDPNGGTGGASSTVNATYNSSDLDSAITSPTRPGHTFGGWYNESGGVGVCVINVSGMLEQNVVGYTNSTGKWNNDTREITLYANWTANTTTVTLDSNGGTRDGTAKATYNSSTITGITQAGKDGGYNVEGYYTAATGGEKVLNADVSLVSGNVAGWVDNGKWANDTLTATLYANWTQTTYTVTYNGNGGTGSAPVDPNSPYASGATVTVLAPGNLVKGGEYFHGWTTNDDGSGDFYRVGDRFTITTDTTLYAKWNTTAPTNCRVIYDGNGATSGTVPVDSTSYALNDPVTVRANTGNLEKTGEYFHGWTTLPDGSGISYRAGDIFTITTDTVLFANWKNTAPADYRVTYHGNGNTSGSVPVDSTSYTLNDPVTSLATSVTWAKPDTTSTTGTNCPTAAAPITQPPPRSTSSGTTSSSRTGPRFRRPPPTPSPFRVTATEPAPHRAAPLPHRETP